MARLHEQLSMILFVEFCIKSYDSKNLLGHFSWKPRYATLMYHDAKATWGNNLTKLDMLSATLSSAVKRVINAFETVPEFNRTHEHTFSY